MGGCTISFWVPPGSLKKKRANFTIFKFSFFAVTWPKMVKNAQNQNHPSIKNLSSLQISAHLAFKWPRKSKKTNFWGGHCLFCGCSGYRVINLCKNLATQGPFGPSLRSVLITFLLQDF